jgi:hypothetical protein
VVKCFSDIGKLAKGVLGILLGVFLTLELSHQSSKSEIIVLTSPGIALALYKELCQIFLSPQIRAWYGSKYDFRAT